MFVEAVPVGVPSATIRSHVCSDRYAIRTRNLQDWNLTRCRCANRSKASRMRDAAAVRLEGDLAQAASAGYRGVALAVVASAKRGGVQCKQANAALAR